MGKSMEVYDSFEMSILTNLAFESIQIFVSILSISLINITPLELLPGIPWYIWSIPRRDSQGIEIHSHSHDLKSFEMHDI